MAPLLLTQIGRNITEAVEIFNRKPPGPYPIQGEGIFSFRSGILNTPCNQFAGFEINRVFSLIFYSPASIF
jgi:hypothetical protein